VTQILSKTSQLLELQQRLEESLPSVEVLAH
jgi:hypothetical protein